MVGLTLPACFAMADWRRVVRASVVAGWVKSPSLGAGGGGPVGGMFSAGRGSRRAETQNKGGALRTEHRAPRKKGNADKARGAGNKRSGAPGMTGWARVAGWGQARCAIGRGRQVGGAGAWARPAGRAVPGASPLRVIRKPLPEGTGLAAQPVEAMDA